MKKRLEVTRGSGNVFRHLGHEDADILNRLGSRVEVKIRVHRAPIDAHEARV